MEVRTVQFEEADSPITLVMEHTRTPTAGLIIGTAQMKAGQRVPQEGESCHPADEYSYVLRGQVRVGVGGQEADYGPGTLMLIPAGEGHVTAALEDAEVLWWWVGKPEDFTGLKTQFARQDVT